MDCNAELLNILSDYYKIFWARKLHTTFQIIATFV